MYLPRSFTATTFKFSEDGVTCFTCQASPYSALSFLADVTPSTFPCIQSFSARCTRDDSIPSLTSPAALYYCIYCPFLAVSYPETAWYCEYRYDDIQIYAFDYIVNNASYGVSETRM